MGRGCCLPPSTQGLGARDPPARSEARRRQVLRDPGTAFWTRGRRPCLPHAGRDEWPPRRCPTGLLSSAPAIPGKAQGVRGGAGGPRTRRRPAGPPGRREARATAANSLCGSWGCGDGVTITERVPSRWRDRASVGSREACPPGVTTVTPTAWTPLRAPGHPPPSEGPAATQRSKARPQTPPGRPHQHCSQGPLGRWRQVQPEIGLLSTSPPRNPDVVTSLETLTCSHPARGNWEGTGRNQYYLVDFEAKHMF